MNKESDWLNVTVATTILRLHIKQGFAVSFIHLMICLKVKHGVWQTPCNVSAPRMRNRHNFTFPPM